MSIASVDTLLKELEAISSETHSPLERRLIDTAVWFHHNKETIARDNIPKRMEFLEKTFDIFLELIAMQVERMQITEGRPKSSSLWLPNGMNASGDMTKFG